MRGPFLCSRAVLPSMIERGSGHIITIASIAGLVAFPGRCAYTASKGAALMLTRSIAVDYAAAGIRANAVCPGMVYTPMTSWRLDQPDLRAQVEEPDPGRAGGPARRDRGRGRAAGLRAARLHDRPPAGPGRRDVRAMRARKHGRQPRWFSLRKKGRDAMTGKLAGKTAVVTGAGSGHRPGRRGAVRAGGRGGRRWWTSTPTAAKDDGRRRSPPPAARRCAVAANVADRLQVTSAFDQIRNEFGRRGRAVQQRRREQQPGR